MNTLAIFCLVVLLPCIWTRSIQKEDIDQKREDDFDPSQYSEEELKEFVNDAIKGMKRSLDEIESFDVKRFTLPKAPPPLPPKKPFNINLGHGFNINKQGLTYTKGNFGAHVIPKYNGGHPRLNFGFHYNW